MPTCFNFGKRKDKIEKRNSSVSAASKLVVLKRRNEVLQIGAS